MSETSKVREADKVRYFRKVIQVKASDSPNVQLALRQQALGLVPTGEVVLPGVVTWSEYCKRRLIWDLIKQCVALDAEFYEGAENLLFPPVWRQHSNTLADRLSSLSSRKALGVGCDPALGGDYTAMAAVDRLGIIELVRERTPHTEVIAPKLIAFARKHSVPWEKVAIDLGGGGHQVLDQMRAVGCAGGLGVAFGKVLSLPMKRGKTMFDERIETDEDKYVYVNRRAELYHALHLLMDPGLDMNRGFAIPRQYTNLDKELAPIPLLYDSEGRIRMLPKDKKLNSKGDEVDELTLVQLIGHSPDEADAVVLAVHAMLHAKAQRRAGAI